jgi:Reverse transcriptase (RNA-dependent DNA polymerase)
MGCCTTSSARLVPPLRHCLGASRTTDRIRLNPLRGTSWKGLKGMVENQIDLRDVADEGLLRRVWRDHVRPMLRSMTFSNLNLTPDPLHYAAYEWGLQTLISSLASDIVLGRYSPERGEIVRMAKRRGLTRPLCFLAPRDALVYSAITTLCRAQLISRAQPWVGAERTDKGQAEVPADAGDSFDWFRFWLAREGHILGMLDDDNVKYLVESDISNFFPSIRLEAVREHLHSQTKLEKEVVRLCVQIIDGVMPRRDYSEVSLMGLPQEQSGSSRYIAHSFLLHVDKEFRKEGEAGRYTRFMDDILIGAETPESGQVCISRWQMSLETLGLYPNGAKTSVIEKGQYLHDAMVSTNAEIENIENKLDNSMHGDLREVTLTPEINQDISEISVGHRTLPDRPKRWDRVTRRIYTLQRRAGVTLWWQYWYSDINDYPGSAPHILEYVRSWPLTQETAERLTELSRRYHRLYPNIALLAAEAMASAPVEKDMDLWNQIYHTCNSHLRWLLKQPSHDKNLERIAAAWLLPSWKFGNIAQRHDLLAQIPSEQHSISLIRVHALPLLVAIGKPLSEWVAAKPRMAWADALAVEYLRSLESGETQAVGVALSLLGPGPRLLPQRYMVLPRALPLVEIIGRTSTKKLSKTTPGIIRKLKQNPDRLRDFRVEFELEKWCE